MRSTQSSIIPATSRLMSASKLSRMRSDRANFPEPRGTRSHGQKLAVIFVPSAVHSEDRSPHFNPAKMAAASRFPTGLGCDVEEVDLPLDDPPDRTGVIKRKRAIAGGQDRLAIELKGLH